MVLPQPAGAQTRVSFRLSPETSRATRSALDTKPARNSGTCSFVATSWLWNELAGGRAAAVVPIARSYCREGRLTRLSAFTECVSDANASVIKPTNRRPASVVTDDLS